MVYINHAQFYYFAKSTFIGSSWQRQDGIHNYDSASRRKVLVIKSKEFLLCTVWLFEDAYSIVLPDGFQFVETIS